MVASAGRLPAAPERFAARAQAVLGAIGTSRREIGETVTRAATLVREVRRIVAG
ncbi:hypothetical protein [Nonomuraea indica]|uniref:Uncharacterized protein n=2 Tax=Nonomuraea indica TaxID=1581193 RepID=A0ABW8A7L6_9ACTN